MKDGKICISLRISLDDLARIDQASKEDNRSRTNFMINASLEKASYYGNN
jgi:uncharacterized protein (DUF1778 family)